MYCTQPETHKAKKHHYCEWCGERIEIGEKYNRYRSYDGSEAYTIKMHQECYAASLDNNFYDGETFCRGDNPRGSNCGWCGDCVFCLRAKLKRLDDINVKLSNEVQKLREQIKCLKQFEFCSA